MIETGTGAPNSFVQRLTRRARQLALAHAETRIRAARRDPLRWRRAALIWPLFSRDT